VLANPTAYLREWRHVFSEFMSSYFVWFGLFRSNDTPQQCEQAQVSAPIYAAVRGLESIWRSSQPAWNYLALFGVPVFILFALRHPHDPRHKMLFIMTTAFTLYALLNTAVEPSLGQARYRMPWTTIIIVADAAFLMYVLRLLGRRAISALSMWCVCHLCHSAKAGTGSCPWL